MEKLRSDPLLSPCCRERTQVRPIDEQMEEKTEMRADSHRQADQ